MKRMPTKGDAPAFGSPGGRGSKPRERLKHIARAFLDASDDGCLEIDANGGVSFANVGARRILGLSFTELATAQFQTLLDVNTAAELAKFQRAALSSDTPLSLRIEGGLARNADLVAQRILLSGVSLPAQRALLVVLRIDPNSSGTHDLRASLTAIQGSVENLLDGLHGAVKPEQIPPLEMIRRNVTRIAQLISKLHDHGAHEREQRATAGEKAT